MKLTERQKKYLRREAHNLKPVVTLGEKGVTDSLVTELDGALDHHELLKVKVRVGDRDTRDELIDELCARSRAILVRRVGNTAVMFRPRKKNSKINLPHTG